MQAILFKNGIYVGVDTDVDTTLDEDKIKESAECIGGYEDGYACFYGNRVKSPL